MPVDRFPALWSGSVAVVRTPPEVDVTIADDMREALLSVLNLGATGVVIDMTRTTFCDSAGVAALIRAHRRASASGAALAVATQSAVVLRLFTLIGVTTVIDVYPDVPAALASLPRPANPGFHPPSSLTDVPGADAPCPAEG